MASWDGDALLLFTKLPVLFKTELAAVSTADVVVLVALLVSRGGEGARFGSADAVSEVAGATEDGGGIRTGVFIVGVPDTF